MPEVVDVDELYGKFEGFEDLVEEGCSKEWKKAYKERQAKGMDKDTRERMNGQKWRLQMAAGGGVPMSSAPPVHAPGNTIGARRAPASSSVEFPSTLSASIDRAKAMKRQNRDFQSNSRSTSPGPSKRRKVVTVTPATKSTSTSKVIQQNQHSNAVAGPSRIMTPQPRKPVRLSPPSPDITFVENPPRQLKRSGSPLPDTTTPKRISVWSGRKVDDRIHRLDTGSKDSRASHTPIILLSDDDLDDSVEVYDMVIPVGPPSKRRNITVVSPQRAGATVCPIELSDDEEDEDEGEWVEPGHYINANNIVTTASSDWNHSGYDIHDEKIWLPLPENENKISDMTVTDKMDSLSLNNSSMERRRRIHPDTSRWSPPRPPPPSTPPTFLWDQLRLAENLRFPPRPRPLLAQHIRHQIIRPFELDFNLHKLKPTQSFKQAPGSIGKIEQKGGWTVIASACAGGLADEPDETPNQYNAPGALMLLGPNDLEIPKGHEARRSDTWTKYYTVNDVKFHLESDLLVSTGQDRMLRTWTLGTDPEDPSHVTWRNIDQPILVPAPPSEIAFKPNSTLLALAERQVRIYDMGEDVTEERRVVKLHNRNQYMKHIVGSILWGSQTTADHLFISTEPTERTFEGLHKVFEVQSETVLYQFDVTEAGGVIALDSDGSTLALCTQAGPNQHSLRLYDVHRRHPIAISTLDLVAFHERPADVNFEGEVNVATFSPDGMYLALARNDNHTHVYDRRMLARGPMFDYEHFGERQVASQSDSYGVVNAQWIQSSLTRRMVLVTGGEDGCVRMWDPLKAADGPSNGTILAQVNSDIGQFSLGDPYAGEHQLIVGDASGEVTVFNTKFS